MTTLDLLTGLKAKGVSIGLQEKNGDLHLKIHAPKGVLTKGDLAQLKLQRKKIIEFLGKVNLEKEFSGIEPVEERDFYPLSPAQKRLFLLQEMTPQSIVYNVFRLFPLARSFSLDFDRLRHVISLLMKRHESLRTSFHMVEGVPVQRVWKIEPPDVEFYDLMDRPSWETEYMRLIREFVRPFDLSSVPLMRMGAVLTGDQQYVLLIDMHHIVTDGMSMDIFTEEFLHFYMESTQRSAAIVPESEDVDNTLVQYKDYCVWLSRDEQQQVIRNQERYWLEHLSGDIPVLELPYDFPRPVIQSFDGGGAGFGFSPEEAVAIKSIPEKYDCTYFMVFLAAYTILLSKLSGQDDIIVGIPVSGRPHDGLGSTFGMFINTLPLRSRLSGEKTFAFFLGDVKEQTVAAFDNQDYPFEEMVEKVGVSRDTGRNPVFDASFNWLNFSRLKKKAETVDSGDYRHQQIPVKFDLSLTGRESNENFLMKLEYCSSLFKPETINRFIDQYLEIIRQVSADPEMKISKIRLMTEDEQFRFIEACNSQRGKYPTDKTLHSLFEEQALKNPHQIALRSHPFTDDQTRTIESSEIPPANTTFRMLNETASQSAVYLLEFGVTPGTIVALIMEPSLEMVATILGVLKCGASYLPVDPSLPLERIGFMVRDSGARFILDTDSYRPKEDFHRRNFFEEESGVNYLDLDNVHWSLRECRDTFATDPSFISLPNVSSDTAVYVIYTSGTTGKPKGVAVNHGNVSPLLYWGYEHLGTGVGDIAFQNLAYYFDWSVWEIFLILTTGGTLLMRPVDVANNARGCGEWLERHAVTVLHCTPTWFRYMLDGRKNWRLKHLKYLCLGAEALSVELLERSLEVVSPECRVFNMYGPTEASIISAIYEVPHPFDTTWPGPTIPIGCPVGNAFLLVLDRHQNPCPINVTGELFIGGDGVAKGYLNRVELTSRFFLDTDQSRGGGAPNPKRQNNEGFPLEYEKTLAQKQEVGRLYCNTEEFSESKNEHKITIGSTLKKQSQFPLNKSFAGGPGGSFFKSAPPGRRRQSFYKTGDLVRWLSDRNLQYIGRVDQQVKVRGLRIELGEIESVLVGHNNVKEAVVVVRAEALWGYIVETEAEVWTDDREMGGELKRFLSGVLPAYMVPSGFMRIDALPLNANGKLDRKRLPVFGEEVRECIAPRCRVEKTIAGIWSGILGVELNRMDIETGFFAMGGHSLSAARMVAEIHRDLNVVMPLAEVFKRETIRGLAEYIKGESKKETADGFAALEPAEKREYYPLSAAQKRLYFIQRLNPGSTGYNMPTVIPLWRKPDRNRLSELFKILVERHESLRTSFEAVNGEVVQRIHDSVRLEIRDVEAGSSFVEPFDLSRPPLLRAGVMEEERNEGTRFSLILDMHHIVTDGESIKVLTSEFDRLARGDVLEPVGLQYKDYSQWQNSVPQQEKTAGQRDFWLNQFRGEVPVLQLPYDFPRPGLKTHEGGMFGFLIGPGETAFIRKNAGDAGATLYMVVLAYFNVLLSKLSGEEDIIIGTPVAGRRHADLQKVTGMFVNTLALRNRPVGNQCFPDFVRELKHRTLEAFENQEYPFEELVDLIAIPRDLSRSPLFDVFISHRVGGTRHREGDQKGDRQEKSPRLPGAGRSVSSAAKFDLTLNVIETDEALHCNFQYCTGLFKPATIERFSGYFRQIISRVMEKPERLTGSIEIITEQEKNVILNELNDTGCEVNHDMTVDTLLEAQIRKNTDRIALAGTDDMVIKCVQVTYGEFERIADTLARELAHHGIGPGDIVPVYTGPRPEIPAVILGILKSGAAFLPIDPVNPVERIQYMLADTGARLLVAGGDGEFSGNFFGDILYINHLIANCKTGKIVFPGGHTSTDPVYVIYTSGTTGRPKGTVLNHGNLVNYIHWFCRFAGLSGGDRTVLTASFGFDLGYTSLFPVLASGGQLHIFPKERYMMPGFFLKYARENKITYLKMTPSLFNVMVHDRHFQSEINRHFRLMVLGGEAINVDDMETAYATYPDLSFMNHYGPTEATIGCIAKIIRPGDFITYKKHPVIGIPISNMKAFIMDRYFNIQPMGIPGELFLLGAGIAGGYLNNPGLTLDTFLPDDSFGSRVPTGNRLPPKNCYYRTGDMTKWLISGEIEFLGRIDSQVKIRGFRVEVGEIEFYLRRIDGIREAVVISDTDDRGNGYLCAYLTETVYGERDRWLTAALRSELEKKIPWYMVPSYFIWLEEIPRAQSNKVDRKALPSAFSEEIPGSPPTALPENEMQMLVAGVWKDVLGREKVGIDQNFFDLGGNSIDLIKAAGLLQDRLGSREIPIVMLFTYPTIRTLAANLTSLTGGSGRTEDIDTPVFDRTDDKEPDSIDEAQSLMLDTLSRLDRDDDE